jgi:Icc protein
MAGGRQNDLRVFAVEDTSVQLTWSDLEAGQLTLDVDGSSTVQFVEAGPGVADVEGLEPGRSYELVATGAGLPRNGRRLKFATLDSPPGDELFRFATLSDMHVGTTHFDIGQRMIEHVASGEDYHPIRCTRAAVSQLLVWGAQRLFLKGDLTEKGMPHQWTAVGKLFGDCPVPVLALPGNHDTKRRAGNVPPDVGARDVGLDLVSDIRHLDVPGLRIALLDTTVPGHSVGRLPVERRRQAVEAVSVDGPAMILLHHYLQAVPIPWFWPPGVPYGASNRFLAAIQESNPRTIISSGHTHRHRRRHVGSIVTTEVGSPKDYPGTWAGYVVHEGGIRQVVRRVGTPTAIEWTEHTRHAAFGAWGRWAPGSLSSRCFTHIWPA